MNWDLVITVIIYMFCARVVVGGVWGMLKLRVTFYDVTNWDWKDTFVAGSAFWIGWSTATGLRYIVKRVQAKLRERAAEKHFSPLMIKAEEDTTPVGDTQE